LNQLFENVQGMFKVLRLEHAQRDHVFTALPAGCVFSVSRALNITSSFPLRLNTDGMMTDTTNLGGQMGCMRLSQPSSVGLGGRQEEPSDVERKKSHAYGALYAL
jgi:hypothetical protein